MEQLLPVRKSTGYPLAKPHPMMYNEWMSSLLAAPHPPEGTWVRVGCPKGAITGAVVLLEDPGLNRSFSSIVRVDWP